MRFPLLCIVAGICSLAAAARLAGYAADPSPIQQDILHFLDNMRPELVAINQDIWTFAELGLQEHRSAARLAGVLKKARFRIKEGVSDMPTAFVAEYGSGTPIIGILAEYDALPELSQQAGDPARNPISGQNAGHGCGHCALGTAAVGAALAVKEMIDKHHLKGTIRLYGTPAEETVIGKVYMTLDGQFKDLDACLHWHPSAKNRVAFMTTKALISAKFTFSGLPAHASGSPEKGRSALDGVELMNVGANYMREHIKETSRIHYVITNGGAQPNVVPAKAQAWYFVRANTHEEVERNFDWLRDIADGAAKMSRTKVVAHLDTDCHEIIPNLPLSRVVRRNMERVGPPKFDDADRNLARRLQEPLRIEFGFKEKKPLNDALEPLPKEPYSANGGSTDVGDISWQVPTSGLESVCFAAGSPGHSWQNVAAIGSPIGHKGLLVAAKVLALSAVDLLQDPQTLKDARADLQVRMKGRAYTTKIPKGRKAPRAIR